MNRHTGSALTVIILLAASGGAVEARDPQLLREGNAALAAGRIEDAAALYAQATGVPGERAVALFNIGVLRSRQGDNTGAAIAFGDALQAGLPTKDGAWAHYNRGIVLLNAGRVMDGITEFKEALRLLPGNSDIRTNLEIAFARARSQASKSDPPPVREELRSMLNRFPEPTYAFTRGRQLARPVVAEKDW